MYKCKCCQDEVETDKVPKSQLCICCFYEIRKFHKKVEKLKSRLLQIKDEVFENVKYGNSYIDIMRCMTGLYEDYDNCCNTYNELIADYKNIYDEQGKIKQELGYCNDLLSQ
jgi:hypothetical protein